MFPVPVFLAAMFLRLWSQLTVLSAAVSCPQKRLYPFRCLLLMLYVLHVLLIGCLLSPSSLLHP